MAHSEDVTRRGRQFEKTDNSQIFDIIQACPV